MAWEITAAGTVTLDDITTPHGRRSGQQGGSAVYFALAACRFVPVHLVGVVGRDGEGSVRGVLRGTRVDVNGLAVVDRPTFRWRAVHDYDLWVTGDEWSDEGPYADWTPAPPAAAMAAPVLFLGSMRPEQQRALMVASSAAVIGADSMTVHIGREAEMVREVALGSDVLFLNRAELAALTGAPEGRWHEAAQALAGTGRLRTVVVKAGPAGAAVVTRDLVLERPAHPVTTVVDPTGAGDALAGGFLGHCAAREDAVTPSVLAAALEAGLGAAAAAVSAFGVEGLRHRDAAPGGVSPRAAPR